MVTETFDQQDIVVVVVEKTVNVFSTINDTDEIFNVLLTKDL